MFKHRRVRVAAVLLSAWVVLAAVERWTEKASWSSAVSAGLLWSGVVAGAWWFAEWTQAGRFRPGAAGTSGGHRREEERQLPADRTRRSR
ncbi:hypothetical protein [Streptomyces marianii]|uniref:Uncharacterized protein n=1 Tax=Streptomyces marianii TaxID=1817406 RepID=A0A5R9E3X8_9ACTN|nr:hypothetical protein [Streptomyces marianii]TLQ42743.1 hypothetical protein FEF34_05785 [Streptomyces marianii]